MSFHPTMNNQTPSGPSSLQDFTVKALGNQIFGTEDEDAFKLFTSFEPRIQ
jgi:hypothetical protein